MKGTKIAGIKRDHSIQYIDSSHNLYLSKRKDVRPFNKRNLKKTKEKDIFFYKALLVATTVQEVASLVSIPFS